MDAPFRMKKRSAVGAGVLSGRFRNGWSSLAVIAVFGWSATVAPAMAQSKSSAPSAGVSTTPPPPVVPAQPAESAPVATPESAPPAAPSAVPAAATAPATSAPVAPPAAYAAPVDGRAVPQAPQSQAPEVQLFTLTELEYLLGPVSLYPDPLLAVMFPAAAFPDQIVEANKWVQDNPADVKKKDFKAVDSKPWDPSVQALTRFPDVLKLLSDNLEWTEALGFAFMAQPNDVSTAIQLLRAKAQKVGNLKSTPQQVVTTRPSEGRENIYITPANPERIYVPTYDSSTVFTTLAAGALVFGTAALVGSTWNNRWGWNNRPWNSIWVAPPAWNRPPGWGPGWGNGWGPGHGPWRPGHPGWGPGPGPGWGPGPGRPGWGHGPGPGWGPGPGQPRPPNWGPGGPGYPGIRPPGSGPVRPLPPGVFPPGGPNRPGVRPPNWGPGGPGYPGVRPPGVRPPGSGPVRPLPPGVFPPGGPNRPGMRPPGVGPGPGYPNRPGILPPGGNRPIPGLPNRPGGRPPGAEGRPDLPTRPGGVRPPQGGPNRPGIVAPPGGVRPPQGGPNRPGIVAPPGGVRPPQGGPNRPGIVAPPGGVRPPQGGPNRPGAGQPNRPGRPPSGPMLGRGRMSSGHHRFDPVDSRCVRRK